MPGLSRSASCYPMRLLSVSPPHWLAENLLPHPPHKFPSEETRRAFQLRTSLLCRIMCQISKSFSAYCEACIGPCQYRRLDFVPLTTSQEESLRGVCKALSSRAWTKGASQDLNWRHLGDARHTVIDWRAVCGYNWMWGRRRRQSTE